MSANTASLWWRQRYTQPASGIARRIVVVTDVAGQILEGDGRSRLEAEAAMDFLAARGIPLVINASRTRAEIERLHQTLQVRTPFFSEYGAALFLPHGSFPFVPEGARASVGGDVIEFGRRYRDVVDTMRLSCREAAVDFVGFAELSIEEAGRELGVGLVEAQLAKLREYTELFRIVGENAAMKSRLFKALRRRGLRCWPAGGHHLVTAAADRAESLRALRRLWKQAWGEPIIIGLGNSEDDAAWLQQVDVAVIVQDPKGGAGTAQQLHATPATVHVTRSSGPHGWSEAIFEHVGGVLLSDAHGEARFPGDRPHAASDGQPP